MTPNIFSVFRHNDARAAADWLVRAFGFEVHVEYPDKTGAIQHAELRHGTGLIGLSSVGPPDPANSWSAVRGGIYVTLEDVDAHHARAKASGTEIIMAPMTTHYGARMYWARDPEGLMWGFSTYKPA